MLVLTYVQNLYLLIADGGEGGVSHASPLVSLVSLS